MIDWPNIGFLTNHLNNSMQGNFTPTKMLLLDEFMMLWLERLIFKQYIKNKRDKYGMKFFKLCIDGGLLLNVEIYSGSKLEGPESFGQTRAVVLFTLYNCTWIRVITGSSMYSTLSVHYVHQVYTSSRCKEHQRIPGKCSSKLVRSSTKTFPLKSTSKLS